MTSNTQSPYFQNDMAEIMHRAYGQHGDQCAPSILQHLSVISKESSTILELGCGSGHLTHHLIQAGYSVIASDASSAMLDLFQRHVTGAKLVQQITLPQDSLPQVDAIVAVGHVLNYLSDEESIELAWENIAKALKPGGLLVLDMQDLSWNQAFQHGSNRARVDDDWVIISEFSLPCATRFVRKNISFLKMEDTHWRRHEEVHTTVLIDTKKLPEHLSQYGLDVTIQSSLGDYKLQQGLVAVIGRKQ